MLKMSGNAEDVVSEDDDDNDWPCPLPVSAPIGEQKANQKPNQRNKTNKTHIKSDVP